MKNFWLSATALVAIAAVPSLASAQGWYGSAAAGYNTSGGIDFDAVANPVGPGASPYNIGSGASGDGGWGGALALGYAFANGFRTEAELGKTSADFKNNGNGSTLGSSSTWSAMLNGLYDFNREGKINPFVGAGVGMARVKALASSYDQAGAANPLTALASQSAVHISDTDSAFAWQLIAGLGLKLSDQLSADLSYKWLNVPDLSFAGTGRYRTNARGGSATQALAVGGSAGGGLGSGGIVGLGLRYAFAKPAAPVVQVDTPPPPPPVEVVTPPPVEPPAPPAHVACDGQSMIVYFEHDKSFLTDEATAKIDNTVNQIKANNCVYKSALIEGHADTSGNARYNVGLSQRRVTIVHDALVARDVPSDMMEGQAFGETKPAVVTADGVKEPMNRRTEVTFTFQ